MKKGVFGDVGVFLAVTAAAFFIALIVIPRFFAVNYTTVQKAEVQAAVAHASTTPAIATTTPVAAVTHVPTPKAVKAIYMSACAAGAPSFRDRLTNLVDTTELNSIVIDVKDFSGTISFPTDNPKLAEVKGPGCTVKDMRAFIERLHNKNIYAIARITVFQDPYYAKLHPEVAIKRKDNGAVWTDKKGLAFIDVGATPFWEYIVALAEESYAIGFDEINFDYIRFPSDGAISNADFTWSVGKGQTKSGAVEKFWAYLDEKLHPQGVVISGDIFGMTTTAIDDMGIGQLLENALKHFDYVAPMVYPSHYPTGFNGWSNVNSPEIVGPLIKFVMDSAVRRDLALKQKLSPAVSSTTASTTSAQVPADPEMLKRINPLQLRPWLQDEDYPVTYTPAMVRAQIQGTYDAGLTSWMLWDAGNKYTPSALLPE